MRSTFAFGTSLLVARSRRMLPAVVALAVIAGTGAAEAEITGFTVAFALSPNNSDDFKSISVACPDGKVAIGGQARAAASSSKVGIIVDAPTNATVAPAAPTGWQAAAREVVPTSSSWVVRVVVLCADVPELVRVSDVDGPSHADGKDAEATCPVGLRPVGGGARISGSFDTPFVQGTHPVGSPPDGWAAAATELGGEAAGEWSLQADVLCADVPDVQIVTGATPLAPASFYAVSSTCPFGTQALGGGGRVVPSNPSQVLALTALSYAAADQWETLANDVGGSGLDWRAESMALCSTALTIHADDFESGDPSAWSAEVP